MKIEYVEVSEKGSTFLKVKVDGKLITGVAFDVGVIRAAVKAKRVSPFMKEAVMKSLQSKLDDFGPTNSPLAIRGILARFEQEFNS